MIGPEQVSGRVVTIHFSDHDKKKQIVNSNTQTVREVLTKQCAQRMMDLAEYNVVDGNGKTLSLDMALVDVVGGEIRFVKKKSKPINDALSTGLSKIGKHTEQIKSGILSSSGTRSLAQTSSGGSIPVVSPRAPAVTPVSAFKPRLSHDENSEGTRVTKRALSEASIQVDAALKERMEAVAQSSRQKAVSRAHRASLNRRPSFNIITLANIPETGSLAQSHTGVTPSQQLVVPDGADSRNGRAKSKGNRASKVGISRVGIANILQKEQRLSLNVSPQDRALFLQQQLLQQAVEDEEPDARQRRPSAKKSYSARHIPRPTSMTMTNPYGVPPILESTPQIKVTDSHSLAASTPPLQKGTGDIVPRIPRPSVSMVSPGTVHNLAEQFHTFKEVRSKRATRMSLKLLAEGHDGQVC